MQGELRRRIIYLMLFRVVLITIVLGITVALNVASPQELSAPGSVSLFSIIILTYGLTLIYAASLTRVANPLRFADAQLAGDLIITTLLVHVTGGAQSGYTFFYPLSIVGAATVRYRRGAVVVAIASVVLLVSVCVLGWLRVLPMPAGAKLVPWDFSSLALAQKLVLNVGACVALGILASNLGEQLARSGRELATELVRTADLDVLKEDIIRCLSSGLVTIDRDEKIMTFNEAAVEILRVPADQAIGRPVKEIIPELTAMLAGMDPSGQLKRGEIRTGQVALGVSVSPLTNHNREAVGRILNFQDLTELRRMELSMRRAENLAVVGGVAAGVAHEIRNPLASISGCIELLKASHHVEDENRALMDIVLREVDRLNALLTDLLDYTRPHERVPMKIDLMPVLSETVRVFAQDRTYPKVRVRLTPETEAETQVHVQVDADPAQLRQVVWNLVKNSAEAMPEVGGDIDVGVLVADGWAEITVKDNGSGIAPEERERIFEPFYTTKTRGSGLGLAMVHRIVIEQGGTVALTSAVGVGTTVTVRLPVLPA